MGWREDSSAGAAIWDTEPLTGSDLQCRDEELAWLMRDQSKSWRLINGRITRSGDPTMLEGLYGGLTAAPPAVNPPTVANTSTATPGVAIWTTTLYTPIPANAVMAPSMYHVMAGGTLQASTTSMTTTILPGIGNVVQAVAPSTFKTLGPSGALTIQATAITTIWHFTGDLIIQQVGTAGTAVFYGRMHFSTAAAPATSAQVGWGICGGTQATALDYTGTTAGFPGGFLLAAWGVTGTETWIPQVIGLASWN